MIIALTWPKWLTLCVSFAEATRVLPTEAERTFVLWEKFPAYFQSLSVNELPPDAMPLSTLNAARKR